MAPLGPIVATSVLVRESTLQFLKYSLDICVSQSIFLQIFISQKGSIEALNFLIIISLPQKSKLSKLLLHGL